MGAIQSIRIFASNHKGLSIATGAVGAVGGLAITALPAAGVAFYGLVLTTTVCGGSQRSLSKRRVEFLAYGMLGITALFCFTILATGATIGAVAALTVAIALTKFNG